MNNYKTFKKEKWVYFLLSVVAYFLPFLIVTAALMPMIQIAKGLKVAIGFGVVIVNTIPFLMGIFKAFFAHFPMLNILAIVFLFLAVFFTADVFRNCVDKFLWIESSAAIGSIASCFLWGKHRKYAKWSESVKANIKSGAFELKEENNNDK